MVVVKLGFRVEVLTGKAQRSVGGCVLVPAGDPPDGRAATPSNAPVLVDQFGRCSHLICDDGKEALVYDVLRGTGQTLCLRLRQRRESVVVPGDGDGDGRASMRRSLFGQREAVPGETRFLDDVLAAGR